ncbi:MAG TPA: NEW3 domain-containing protein [Candidatus Saccharimonadales bacterium]|nr:NEW3 domain-containing protein [Candidatus Saccharimonadales bacterium]
MRRSISSRVRVPAALVLASLVLASIAPTVAADDGLQVTTPYPAVAVAPGSKVSFDLTVTSVRTAEVSLALGGVPAGWTASLLGGGFVVDGVSVTPSTDGTVRLDVSVPADAAPATQTIRVTANGGGATDVLALSIRVNEEAGGDVSLTTTTPSLTGSSDASFSFNLTFNNDTAQDVTVSVAATGDPTWTINAKIAGEEQAASSVVTAGSTVGIEVTAQAPANAPAATYPITVTAQAGEQATSADLAIQITGSYSMTLSTPNDLLSLSGSAGAPTTQTFDITNTGTAPITGVALTATPPTGWEVTFDPETLDPIAPQGTGTITATITPSAEAVAGDYVVTFDATGTEGGAEASSQLRFTVETSPLWAFVGLGLIVLILGGLFYVFRTYGRR